MCHGPLPLRYSCTKRKKEARQQPFRLIRDTWTDLFRSVIYERRLHIGDYMHQRNTRPDVTTNARIQSNDQPYDDNAPTAAFDSL